MKKVFLLVFCFGVMFFAVSTAKAQDSEQVRSSPPLVEHRQRTRTVRQDIRTNIGGSYSRRWRPRIDYRVTVITQDVDIRSTVRNRPPYVRVYTPGW